MTNERERKWGELLSAAVVRAAPWSRVGLRSLERKLARIGVKVHLASLMSDELPEHMKSLQDCGFPVGLAADPDLELPGRHLDRVEQALVEAMDVFEHVVLRGVTEDDGGDALFGDDGAAAVLVLVDCRIASPLPFQDQSGDG